MRNPWNSYRQVATQTASPGQLVLMLYDGAIRFLERALQGFENDDPSMRNETIHNNIARAQEILHELNMSLNVREGGEFASRLRGLYNYMDGRLLGANLTKKPEHVVETVQRLTILRDAWATMLRQRSEQAVGSSASEALAA